MGKVNKFENCVLLASKIVEAIPNWFAAIVLVLVFFGLALFNLSFGLGDLSGELRGRLISLLIYVMMALVVVLPLFARSKPSRLGMAATKPGDIK